MSSALLLVPDFSLILIGWLLVRYTPFDRAFWSGVERLVYFVLFPALLLQSTNSARFDFSSTSAMLGLALATTAFGVVTATSSSSCCGRPRWTSPRGSRPRSASSCIGLALASRLGGSEGLALMALVVGVTVPLCNVVAVWALARHGSRGCCANWRAIR